MAKSHLQSSDTALKAGEPMTVACGAEIQKAYFPMSTRTNSTPDHNSLLSAAESQTLARIAQDRRSGFMVSGPDVDFLLEVIARLTV